MLALGTVRSYRPPRVGEGVAGYVLQRVLRQPALGVRLHTAEWASPPGLRPDWIIPRRSARDLTVSEQPIHSYRFSDTHWSLTVLPRPTIEAFDAWLATRTLRFDAIVVGGSALALLGVIDRQTRDFDILDPEVPNVIARAAREFAAHLRGTGVELADDWLNNGPIQLRDVLREGWQLRTRALFVGNALILTTLGRPDLLATKLFALCDRGTDLSDCLALAPTAAELADTEPWLVTQDTNPIWPEHVRATLDDLRRRLGHGL